MWHMTTQNCRHCWIENRLLYDYMMIMDIVSTTLCQLTKVLIIEQASFMFSCSPLLLCKHSILKI
jgi:hypothetical protein